LRKVVDLHFDFREMADLRAGARDGGGNTAGNCNVMVDLKQR